MQIVKSWRDHWCRTVVRRDWENRRRAESNRRRIRQRIRRGIKRTFTKTFGGAISEAASSELCRSVGRWHLLVHEDSSHLELEDQFWGAKWPSKLNLSKHNDRVESNKLRRENIFGHFVQLLLVLQPRTFSISKAFCWCSNQTDAKKNSLFQKLKFWTYKFS